MKRTRTIRNSTHSPEWNPKTSSQVNSFWPTKSSWPNAHQKLWKLLKIGFRTSSILQIPWSQNPAAGIRYPLRPVQESSADFPVRFCTAKFPRACVFHRWTAFEELPSGRKFTAKYRTWAQPLLWFWRLSGWQSRIVFFAKNRFLQASEHGDDSAIRKDQDLEHDFCLSSINLRWSRSQTLLILFTEVRCSWNFRGRDLAGRRLESEIQRLGHQRWPRERNLVNPQTHIFSTKQRGNTFL